MTSARERLAMLHSHIKDNSNTKMLEEFPLLVQSERQQYLNSNFQSVPRCLNSSYFASSVTKPLKKLGMAISSPIYDDDLSRGKQYHIEGISNDYKSTSTTTKLFSNLEFDDICTNVDKKLRLLLGSESHSDSYMISGKDIMGWEFLGSNIIESLEGDVLCVSTGFYSKAFAKHLQNYVELEERNVTIIEAEIGYTVPLEIIENELAKKRYGIISLTHTDSSTGIVTNIEEISHLVKQISPTTLIAVDAIYSAGIEEILVDKWGADFTLTAYQSTELTTEVLSHILLSSRAILKTNESSQHDSSSSDTFKVQLAYSEANLKLLSALDMSLKRVFGMEGHYDISMNSSNKLQSRLVAHILGYKLDAERLRKSLVSEESGITTLSQDWTNCSNGMTAIYLPKNVKVSEFLKMLNEEFGTSLVKSIHPSIAPEYISIEHAGFKLSNSNFNVDKIIETFKKYLKK